MKILFIIIDNIKLNNGVEIQSATYSVNSCIAENYENSALGNLFVALANFGASAYNFEK